MKFSLCIGCLLVLALGCGHPEDDSGNTTTPVNGNAFFGTQCPYGSFSDPTPAKLELLNCPTGLQVIEISQPLQPMILQADCKKKVISVRNFDRRTDSEWELMPDGSYQFTVDAGTATLVNDGSGKSCTAALSAFLSGQVDCSVDRDKVLIAVDAAWSFKKDASSTAAAAASTNSACALPQSCYFHSSAKVRQCQ